MYFYIGTVYILNKLAEFFHFEVIYTLKKNLICRFLAYVTSRAQCVPSTNFNPCVQAVWPVIANKYTYKYMSARWKLLLYIYIYHCKLDIWGKVQFMLHNIIGTTLWSLSSTSFNFTHKCRKYKLEIQNIFFLICSLANVFS